MEAVGVTVATGRYLWGQKGEGRNVLEAAEARTRYAFDNFDDVFVLFSGGKDSTAVLNVALAVARDIDCLPLRVVFYDEECVSRETVDYVRRTAELDDVALEWYCLPVRHRNGCSNDEPFWWPWAPESRDIWTRPLPPEAITELEGFTVEPPEARLSIPDTTPLLVRGARKTAALMGIRADESMTRRMAVANHRPDNFVIPVGAHAALSKVYPVYDWKTADVWTAPALMGWDYNATYDVMEMAGIPHGTQRVAPPFGEEPMQLLWMWAQCFPDQWALMCDRVPGAAAAARYSKTELYSFGSQVDKPDDITWQDFIAQRIGQQSEDVREFVAYKVRGEIRRHYRDTHEPIMPTAPHPDSGVCWARLYVLADRADVKNRRSMGGRVPGNRIDEFRKAYDEERAAVQRGEISL